MCDQVDDEPVKVSNVTTKSDTERERAEFEAWYLENNDVPHEAIKRKGAGYDWIGTDEAWETWQARAALQSQYLEDAERLEWLVENMCRVDIDEGHRGWFVLERDTTNYLVEDCKTFREAIDHARRAEGGGE